MRERFHVFVNTVKILVLCFADGVAVPRAHRVNENQVRFVEQGFRVVHEFVRRGGREGAVKSVRPPRPERAHVQPHRG